MNFSIFFFLFVKEGKQKPHRVLLEILWSKSWSKVMIATLQDFTLFRGQDRSTKKVHKTTVYSEGIWMTQAVLKVRGRQEDFWLPWVGRTEE